MGPDRSAILRRRMAFLGSALASLPGCDKSPPPPRPTPVLVGQPDGPAPAPDPADTGTPTEPKIPPHPSTEIPATSCAPDREELLRMKAAFDAMYAEAAAIYAELPGCKLTDDACVPRHEPIAKRYAKLDDGVSHLLGMCGCPAPIVTEYVNKHRAELVKRLGLIRDRIVATGDDVSGERWERMVQEEATPRPCLSCVRCEEKSACDP